jgi:hypothetical protein
MKTLKNKLPEMAVKSLYKFKRQGFILAETSGMGDPTNNCGTILSTTHLMQK